MASNITLKAAGLTARSRPDRRAGSMMALMCKRRGRGVSSRCARGAAGRAGWSRGRCWRGRSARTGGWRSRTSRACCGAGGAAGGRRSSSRSMPPGGEAMPATPSSRDGFSEAFRAEPRCGPRRNPSLYDRGTDTTGNVGRVGTMTTTNPAGAQRIEIARWRIATAKPNPASGAGAGMGACARWRSPSGGATGRCDGLAGGA